MRFHFLRLTLIGPVVLFLLILSTGTTGAASVGHLSIDPRFGVVAHHYTPRHLTVAQLNMKGSGTHYLYVDDGTCPDSIDVYKTGTSLTHVGNYATTGCNSFAAFGGSNIAVATTNGTHGTCLIYGNATSSNTGFMASYPINANGSLGSEINQVNTASGAEPSDVKVTPDGNFAYEINGGVDIESFGIGTGCTLTQLKSIPVSSQFSLSLALLGSYLLTTDLHTSNIYIYTLGSGGSITFKATVAGQFTAPDSIAVQSYTKRHKTHYRIFTGQAPNGAPSVQGANFDQGKGTITFLKHSPATDPSGSDGAAVFFDSTHSFLIQGEQLSSTLANYRVNANGLTFVSETHMAVSSTQPSSFASLGTTLFVDGVLFGDVEACTLTPGGATNCATVATLTNTTGVSAGIALY